MVEEEVRRRMTMTMMMMMVMVMVMVAVVVVDCRGEILSETVVPKVE
jgi:hypothetical protein